MVASFVTDGAFQAVLLCAWVAGVAVDHFSINTDSNACLVVDELVLWVAFMDAFAILGEEVECFTFIAFNAVTVNVSVATNF